METVFDAFQETVERLPDHDCVAMPPREARDHYPEGVSFSYREVAKRVRALRETYERAGYGHGHRVAMLIGNRPEFLFHYLALNGLGVGVVPVNPDYVHDEMLYQMEHSEADLAVAVSARVADLEAVAQARKKPLPVVDIERWPQSLPRPSPPPHNTPPGTESECALLYTSGTTGRPKGCILTNYYYLNAGRWYLDLVIPLGIEHGVERMLNPLPLYHMNCMAITVTAMILHGGCSILVDRFHPKHWWLDTVNGDATMIHYLGAMPPILMSLPKVPEERAHRIKLGFGAGIDPVLHRAFEERFGFPIYEGWGMTETGRIYANVEEPRRIDTRAFGKPLPGLEARVVDDDDNDVAPGVEGELIVRHSEAEPRKGFFSGYLKNPEATAEAWHNGWFRTGDVVVQDEDGMLYFVDRKKNIIRRSGENIAAAEVEAVLIDHPAVAQVAVLAVADELREEEVMACLVPMSGVEPGAGLADELMAWCLERLAYFKAPGWFLFVDALPTTGTQKVQKTQIFPAGEDPRTRPGVIDSRDRKKRQA